MKKLTALLLSLAFALGTGLPAMAQGLKPADMASFENFLKSHPNTARELQQNPNLINDPQWIGHHQGLEEYMSTHPNVRADVHQNPGAFINNGGHWTSNHGNGSEAASFQQGYLNQHPEVAQQLAHNPGLADNQQYLDAHPGLNGYLQGHPNVRYDLEHHPDRFMSRADSGYYNHAGNPEWNGEHPHELATGDNYFDHHPDVYQQMQKNPRLVDNQHYVDSHPGLHDYLEDHPHAREAFKNHPDAFMHAEEHYDQHHSHPHH
jgi:hypothetical protein